VIESPRAKESAHNIGRGPGTDSWCTNCGLPLQPRQRFCAGCGEAVDGGRPHRRTARTSAWPLGIAVLSVVLTLVAVLLLGGALLGIGWGSLPGQSPAVTPAPELTIAPSVLPTMPPSQEPAVNAQATPTPFPPTVTPSAPDRIREARAVLDGGDAARAIELLTALKRQEVSDPSLDETLYQAFLKHGQITLGRNELDLSYAMFAEALKLKPNDPAAQDGQKQVVLAKNWAKMEATWTTDQDASIAALEEIFRSDPNYRDARAKLYAQLVGKAERLLSANKRDEALPVLRRAMEVNPNGDEARRHLRTYTPTPVPTLSAPSLEDAVATVQRYTVRVWTDHGRGSGVSLGGGMILTNFHVIEDGSWVQANFASGRQGPVRVVRVDPRRDLALLQSSFGDEPSAPIRDPASLRQAEALIAVGYPLTGIIGTQNTTVTRGIFSGRWLAPWGVGHVQTDTSINPGNSGGPLADAEGRLVGIVTFGIRDAAGINFAVASDEVKAFIQDGSAVTRPAPAPAAPTARPVLSSHTVAPRSVPVGGTITLTYVLNNPGTTPVTATLGASIRTKGGGRWIDDPANDKKVTIPPGTSTHTRVFRVPAGTAPGSYDVAWGLFGEAKQNYAFVVESGILTIGR
jgi:S1-C subfamily serine protease